MSTSWQSKLTSLVQLFWEKDRVGESRDEEARAARYVAEETEVLRIGDVGVEIEERVEITLLWLLEGGLVVDDTVKSRNNWEIGFPSANYKIKHSSNNLNQKLTGS